MPAPGSCRSGDERRAIADRYIDRLCDAVADLTGPRPAWQARAACLGVGVAVFYPEPCTEAAVAAAVRYCVSCPVQRECAAAGERERNGIWGGRVRVLKSERQARRASSVILDGAAGL
jgi:hypothetical protein